MKKLRSAFCLCIFFTVLCGGIYPVLVTGLAQWIFPQQAQGSLITDTTGLVRGSRLIGQPFSDPKYLWPRPSATTDFAYNPLASGGSNLSITNPAYLKTVTARLAELRHTGIQGPMLAEMVQASASGLDPHISPQAALMQIARIAKARGISEARVAHIIAENMEERQLGFMGLPRINVLAVNLALESGDIVDTMQP
jgi:K+-transporting ATPase ATPase C chain